MRPNPWLIVVLAGALLGLLFAGVSTHDFVQHLDRQEHSVSCSFVPGMGADDPSSGCAAAMKSEYSSVLRSKVWGGIPISLPAMSVFAFLLFFGAEVLLSRRQGDRRATGLLALAALVPALASLVMAIISITKLGTVCKLCAGIYLASALCLVGAVILWLRARSAVLLVPREAEQAGVPPAEPTVSQRYLASATGVGVLFVGFPLILYLVLAPDHSKYIGTCDGLTVKEDTYGVMVPIGSPGGEASAVEIFDPLCPACRAFEHRLESSGLGDRLARKALLFPLESECNWMVQKTVHPGACVVSYAALCAGTAAPEVIDWAFEQQDAIREAAKVDPRAVDRMVQARFPQLAECIASPKVKSDLHRGLTWAVDNGVQVMTPQLYVEGVKLCQEDVDLGLEFALGQMLERNRRHALVVTWPPKTEPAEELVPGTAKPVEPATPRAADTRPRPTAPATAPDEPVEPPPGTAAAPAGDTPEATEPARQPEPSGGEPAADKPADKPETDKPAEEPAPPPAEPAPSEGGAP